MAGGHRGDPPGSTGANPEAVSPASERSSPTGPHADQDSESWLSSLQQAARLEADRGFGDLMGRHESFASFVARCLAAPPSSLSADSHSVFAPLAESFRQYPEASLSRRQQLVRQLRQGLHQEIGRAHV